MKHKPETGPVMFIAQRHPSCTRRGARRILLRTMLGLSLAPYPKLS